VNVDDIDVVVTIKTTESALRGCRSKFYSPTLNSVNRDRGCLEMWIDDIRKEASVLLTVLLLFSVLV